MNFKLINWMGKAYPTRIVEVPGIEGIYGDLLIGTTDFKNALEDMDSPALDAIMWKSRILCYVDQEEIFLPDNKLIGLVQKYLKEE